MNEEQQKHFNEEQARVTKECEEAMKEIAEVEKEIAQAEAEVEKSQFDNFGIKDEKIAEDDGNSDFEDVDSENEEEEEELEVEEKPINKNKIDVSEMKVIEFRAEVRMEIMRMIPNLDPAHLEKVEESVLREMQRKRGEPNNTIKEAVVSLVADAIMPDVKEEMSK